MFATNKVSFDKNFSVKKRKIHPTFVQLTAHTIAWGSSKASNSISFKTIPNVF